MKIVTTSCKSCKTMFSHKLYHHRTFCSKKCAAKYNNINFRWKNKSHPIIVRFCKFCNKKFKIRYKHRSKIFCSSVCWYKFYSKHSTEYILHFGHKPSKETRRKLSLKTSGKNNPMYGKVAYPKLKYSKLLGHSIRSSWEYCVCNKLKENKIKYEYEAFSFPLIVDKKETTYTPDLFIFPNLCIEIKGPLFDWQRKKMMQFVKISKYRLITVSDSSIFKKLNFAYKTFNIKKLDTLISYLKRIK